MRHRRLQIQATSGAGALPLATLRLRSRAASRLGRFGRRPRRKKKTQTCLLLNLKMVPSGKKASWKELGKGWFALAPLHFLTVFLLFCATPKNKSIRPYPPISSTTKQPMNNIKQPSTYLTKHTKLKQQSTSQKRNTKNHVVF